LREKSARVVTERSSGSEARCPHCQSLLPIAGIATLAEPHGKSGFENDDEPSDSGDWRATRGIFDWSEDDPPAHVNVRQMRDATRR